MAMPTTPPVLARQTNTGAVAVVGSQYCAPYPTDLTIIPKAFSCGDYLINDVDGKLVMQVKGQDLGLRTKCVLFDASGNPVVTFQIKLMSMHGRWKVFRGDSTKPMDYLFTVKMSSLFQLNIKLDVFLAGNTPEKACDFKVKQNFSGSSCTVNFGNSSESIIAEMHKKHKFACWKTKYKVTVHPRVDYAFIIVLIVILQQINSG